MDIQYYISIWRKFWNFLEGLYPVLGRLREKISRPLSPVLNCLGVTAFLDRQFATKRGQALRTVGTKFYWKDMTRDRESLAGLPLESLIVLRPVFLLSLALCLLLPFTLLFPYPAVAPSAIYGARGPVAGWSVALWALAIAMAWGCALAGTGAGNRPAATLAADLYLFVMLVMSPVGSNLNLIPVFTTLFAVAVCEHRRKQQGLQDKLAGLTMCLLVGIPCGVVLGKSLPAWNVIKEAGMPGRFALGAFLGLAVFSFGRSGDVHPSRLRLPAFVLPLHRTVLTVFALTLLFFICLGFTSDFGTFANLLLRGEHYLTGFLWPVWYFIGVGIIFKILKHSTTIADVMRDMVRPSFFIPLILLLLVAALAATLSYTLVAFGDVSWWPLWIIEPAWKIYSATKDLLWKNPMYSFSLVPMTWVFVFDLLAVIWLAVKRMLDAERVAALLFYTLLAWFLIFEYYFESFGLTRSPHHSVLILFLSSIWLLWFLCSLGLRVSIKSSPLWPASARLPTYGALLLFILLQFHAQTAIRDFKMLNEIFFFLFRGVIDIGFPFMLYVYAGRRLGELPVPLSRLFAFFCLGGALTIPLTIMDKLAELRWSWPALRAVADARYHQMIVQGTLPANRALVLPDEWTVIRAAIVMGILLIAALGVKRANRGRPQGPAHVIFFVTAVAMGLAGFSNTLIVLPFVPPRWEMFYRPVHQSLLLDHNLFFLYLTYNIPALILTLSLTHKKARSMLLPAVGVVVAVLTHLGLKLVWPAYRNTLLATGLADTLVAGGIGLLVLLIYLARRRLDTGQVAGEVETVTVPAPAVGFIQSPETTAEQPQTIPGRPVVGPTAQKVFVSLGTAVLLGVALFQWTHRAELPKGYVLRKVPGLDRLLPMSTNWVPVPADKLPPDTKALFIRRGSGRWKPMLSVNSQPYSGRSVRIVLGKIDEELRKEPGVHYRRIKTEDWGHLFQGALAEDYHMDVHLPNGHTFHLTATTLLLPQSSGKAAILTLVAEPVDWSRLQAELARSTQLLAASANRIPPLSRR